jgi:hypothetical protein
MEVLNWSKRGDVGCIEHSPEPSSERWRLEGWSRIPASVDGRHGRWFQCPSCDPAGRCYRQTAEADRFGAGHDARPRAHAAIPAFSPR